MGTLALNDYTPPEPDPIPEPLTKIQKDKVKARIRTILAGKVMDEYKVVHLTIHYAPREDGVAVTIPQVREVIREMGDADEFLPGHGSPLTKLVAEPTEL